MFWKPACRKLMDMNLNVTCQAFENKGENKGQPPLRCRDQRFMLNAIVVQSSIGDTLTDKRQLTNGA
jgi:hypothetical protein